MDILENKYVKIIAIVGGAASFVGMLYTIAKSPQVQALLPLGKK